MTGKTYKNIYYHIVFGTNNRYPYLHEDLRLQVFHFILNKCKHLELYLHRIGGIEDHIHMLVTIPPKLAVADMVGQIKGSSSYFVNQELLDDDTLYWQRGYGVFTLSKKDVPKVKNYIQNQTRHHEEGSLWDELEEINIDDDIE